MFHVLRRAAEPGPGNRTVRFEGEPYGAGVSFFLVDFEPGEGPPLHRHPYPETWVVRAGRALFAVDDDELEVGPGDVVVAAPGTPHRFRNGGSGRLEMVCIHAAGRMTTEWLGAPERGFQGLP